MGGLKCVTTTIVPKQNATGLQLCRLFRYLEIRDARPTNHHREALGDIGEIIPIGSGAEDDET